MTTAEFLLARKLGKGSGGDVTVEELTVTENGIYQEQGKAYTPVKVELPLDSKTITANGTYTASDDNLAGYDEVTVAVEGYAKKSISNTPTDIATFNASALPMPSLTVGIEATQDLHGYDSPWVGGAGKNKLEVTATTQTLNGITFTVNSDGTIKANGTATANTTFVIGKLVSGSSGLTNGNILNGSILGDLSTWFITMNSTPNAFTSGRPAISTMGDSTIGNIAPNVDYYVMIGITSGVTVNNVVFKPMIRLASEQDATFAPYSNICPISGHTEANVSVSGVNIWDEEWENGLYLIETGEKRGDNNRIRNKNPISVKPNTQYYMHSYGSSTTDIIFLDKNGDYISYNYVRRGNNFTFVTPNECYYINFCLFPNYGATYNNNVSINYPSTDTEYHAYNGQTYTIDLDGTRYGCTLDVVSGELTVDRAYYNISDITFSESGNYYRILDNSIPFAKSQFSEDGILSHFNYGDREECIVGTTPSSGHYIMFYKNKVDALLSISSVADFNAYLVSQKTNGNPVQLVYKLATPITIQLTPTMVKSLLGTNNLWADTGDVVSGEYMEAL